MTTPGQRNRFCVAFVADNGSPSTCTPDQACIYLQGQADDPEARVRHENENAYGSGFWASVDELVQLLQYPEAYNYSSDVTYDVEEPAKFLEALNAERKRKVFEAILRCSPEYDTAHAFTVCTSLFRVHGRYSDLGWDDRLRCIAFMEDRLLASAMNHEIFYAATACLYSLGAKQATADRGMRLLRHLAKDRRYISTDGDRSHDSPAHGSQWYPRERACLHLAHAIAEQADTATAGSETITAAREWTPTTTCVRHWRAIATEYPSEHDGTHGEWWDPWNIEWAPGECDHQDTTGDQRGPQWTQEWTPAEGRMQVKWRAKPQTTAAQLLQRRISIARTQDTTLRESFPDAPPERVLGNPLAAIIHRTRLARVAHPHTRPNEAAIMHHSRRARARRDRDTHDTRNWTMDKLASRFRQSLGGCIVRLRITRVLQAVKTFVPNDVIELACSRATPPRHWELELRHAFHTLQDGKMLAPQSGLDREFTRHLAGAAADSGDLLVAQLCGLLGISAPDLLTSRRYIDTGPNTCELNFATCIVHSEPPGFTPRKRARSGIDRDGDRAQDFPGAFPGWEDVVED
jgi:hypothetical protein